MTRAQIAAMIAGIGLPYAYDHFIKEDSPGGPPFIAFMYPNNDDLYADNINYARITALHIELYTIEDHERLSITIERTDTTDKHGSTLFQVARMHVHTDIATQFLRHLLVDRQAIAVRDETILSSYRRTILIHRSEGIAQHVDTNTLTLVTSLDAYLL
jgi:hypothetical protein